MKRFLIFLLLFPSLVLGDYTEFYCQNGGSNLNACSTTNNTAAYTSIHGNWVQATGVFTPTDGSTPSSTVNVGDWASVYIDGASVGVYIGRISAVGAGVNGAITANTNGVGSKPANQTGTATINVGGACQGPNATSGYPLSLFAWGINKDATAHQVRLNLKNDQTYSVTASFNIGSSGAANVVQGYTSSTNDGGRATLDGGTSTGQILGSTGTADTSLVDLIFQSSITTGTTNLVVSSVSVNVTRCVFTGARNSGLVTAANAIVIECEAYDNNKANSSSKAGFEAQGTVNFKRCISHDNTGSNTSGFIVPATGVAVVDSCVADTNGQYGIALTGTTSPCGITISNCDIYNNTSDGINIATNGQYPVLIENTNLIKNGGKGINNVSVVNSGFVFNCGYGAGTMANGSADALNNLSTSGAVTYANDVTPSTDPGNGDFSINLAAAEGAGRGAFTTTASSYGPTVGYPEIGAAQAAPTVCPPTPTPCPSSTPGGGETSYAFPQ